MNSRLLGTLALAVLAFAIVVAGCGGSSSSQGGRSGTGGESQFEPAQAAIAAGEELAEREKECRSESPKSTECEEVEYEAIELNRQYNQNFEEEANAKLYGNAEAEAAERGEYDRLKGIERLQIERGEVPGEVEIQPKGGAEEAAGNGGETPMQENYEKRLEEQEPLPATQEQVEEFKRTHNGETENEFFANHGGDGPG